MPSRRASSFDVRVVVLAPGAVQPFAAAAWQGALVLVARGQLELVAADEQSACFEAGAMLALDRLPLRALRNPGGTPTQLIVVTRRETVQDSA